MVGQRAEDMLAGFLAGGEIATLAEPQHHVEKAVLGLPVGDGKLLTADRANANPAEREDAGFHRGLADDFDDLVQVDAAIEIGRIFNREVRHAGSLPENLPPAAQAK